MKLTILGNNGPFPAAGGACSGYLLQNGSTNILIDCGNGVLANLQKFIRFDDLDLIILTHMHSDHVSDLQVLKYAIQIKRRRSQFDKLLKICAPPEPKEEWNRIDVSDAFDLTVITEDTVLEIGDLHVTFSQMKHPAMDFAVKMECSGRCLVFSGDTSWTENIITFARGADLLMLDAGLLDRDYTESAVHLTAAQCGRVASEAGAKRLLLTHFWPDYDVNELLAEARRHFAGAEAAELLQQYEI